MIIAFITAFCIGLFLALTGRNVGVFMRGGAAWLFAPILVWLVLLLLSGDFNDPEAAQATSDRGIAWLRSGLSEVITGEVIGFVVAYAVRPVARTLTYSRW